MKFVFILPLVLLNVAFTNADPKQFLSYIVPLIASHNQKVIEPLLDEKFVFTLCDGRAFDREMAVKILTNVDANLKVDFNLKSLAKLGKNVEMKISLDIPNNSKSIAVVNLNADESNANPSGYVINYGKQICSKRFL